MKKRGLVNLGGTIAIKMEKRAPGYTLIEAIITVSVVAVITVIVAPGFSDFLRRQSVRADNQFALKAFNMARTQAMVIDDAATVVCWNSSSVNTVMADADGTSYTLSPGEIIVAEGTLAAFDEIITSGQINGESNSIFDNDADDCVEFTAQGRLLQSTSPTLAIVFCREAGDTEDALRLEVIAGGRVGIKKNSGTSGLGSLACS